MLIKKLEENKEEESQETLTLQGWIWEKMVKIGENISLGTSFKITCKKMSKRRIDITMQKEKHIMGITAENTVMTSTMYDSVKSLSEEEWEWVTMTHEELKGLSLIHI